MARIRTIKPSFFTSEPVASLTDRDARLTFIGLWTHVDDAGRCVDNARIIKGALWSLDDDVTPEVVEKHLSMLEERALIVRYQVNGRRVLQVTGFDEHQTINRPTPSRLPPPEYQP